MDKRAPKLDRRISERVERLNVSRGLPWQVPGVVSAALNDEGRVTRSLATESGLFEFGPCEK